MLHYNRENLKNRAKLHYEYFFIIHIALLLMLPFRISHFFHENILQSLPFFTYFWKLAFAFQFNSSNCNQYCFFSSSLNISAKLTSSRQLSQYFL